MAKILLSIALLVSIALNLCSCQVENSIQETTRATSAATLPSTQPTTLPVPTDPTVTTAPAVQADPLTETPHLETISRADQPIYSGPGYEYNSVGTVQIAGVYTIVEETYDNDLHIWGRLKSGVGWIDLSNSRDSSVGAPTESLANCFKFTLLDQLKPGNIEFVDPSNAYLTYVSMEALGDLFHISLHAGEIDWDSGTYKIGTTLFSAPSLGKGQNFVAGISLPGDFSFCVVSCQDSAGIFHYYELSISLKDGHLVAQPFNP